MSAFKYEEPRCKIALIQLLVTDSKQENLRKATEFIGTAAKNGAKIICLPEQFNCPIDDKMFPIFAEEVPGGETCKALSQAAKENGVYVIGGSFSEKEEGSSKLFNTCVAFDPNGNLVAKHRKMHLFDVNIPGKITFTESNTFGPGNDLNTFDTPYGKIGLGICYDVRFYEICGIYQRMGCTMLFFPSAFGLVTGSAHWELYARTRALDNQLYVSMCSPARNTSADYVCWGNSSVGNPYGQLIAKAGLDEEILYADVDLEKMAEVRAGLPYLSQKRNELYELKYLKN